MADHERKFLDRTFDSPAIPSSLPIWARGASPVVALAVLAAFVLSLLAMALLL